MTQIASVGQRALACLGGPWLDVTIHRINSDGTYHVVPVGEEGQFMAEWECLTRAEVVFDDADHWPAVMARHGAGDRLGWTGAGAALRGVGVVVADDDLRQFWDERGRALGGTPSEGALELDAATAYRVMRSIGHAAAVLADPARDPNRRLFKLYWNQIRMGGRDPADVGHPITLADALAATDLADAALDPDAVAALARFEATHGLTLPVALTAMWSRAGATELLCDAHCNNPEPRDADGWTLRRDLADVTGTRFAMRLIDPHQGDHGWWLAFDDGAADGAVWLSFAEDGPPVRQVADSLAFFVWDLATTNRTWEEAEADDDEDDDDADGDDEQAEEDRG